MKNDNYMYEEVETFGMDGIRENEKKLLSSSFICFNYMLQEMKDGVSNIILYLPDVLIEKKKIKENVYSFADEKLKVKTTIFKKYYFPVRTKKKFLDELRNFCKDNYIVKGIYGYNDIENVKLSSYSSLNDNISNAHFIDLTIYTKEKFRECFINELNELQRVYDETLKGYLDGTLNLSIDIDELYNNELSRLLDFYDELDDKNKILDSLNIKPKTYVRKY